MKDEVEVLVANVCMSIADDYYSTQSTYLYSQAWVSNCIACTSIVTTGHSLGGALATLAAVDLMIAFPNLTVSSQTFGSPRVGNPGSCV